MGGYVSGRTYPGSCEHCASSDHKTEDCPWSPEPRKGLTVEVEELAAELCPRAGQPDHLSCRTCARVASWLERHDAALRDYYRMAFQHNTERMQAAIADVAALRSRLALAEQALHEARAEITYWHADMLTPEARAHPRGSGWARVMDKINEALYGRSGETQG